MSVQEASKRLNKLIARAEKLGIKKEELVQFAQKQVFNNDQKSFDLKKWILLPMALLLIYNTTAPVIKTEMINYWMKYNDRDSSEEKCVFWMPDAITRATRPPEDCAMCWEITSVPRVQNITPIEFEDIYAYSGQPVIITDAMINWTAPEKFNFKFFKELYKGTEGKQSKCQFFPYKTEFSSLHEVFNMTEERAQLREGSTPWYVGWSNCEESIARILRQHYSRPYFLPETSENKNIDWIFMGSPGYGAQMHVDNVNHPSWQAQLVGSKQWTLQPPPECMYECQSIDVIVHPGDIIVLDTNRWYHKTLIVSEGISITIGAEYD